MVKASAAPGMEGIYRRGGRLLVSVWNPGKGASGGKEWHTLPVGATLRDAKSFKRELELQKSRGNGHGKRGADATVAEWVGMYDGGEWVPGRWLVSYPRKAESTNQHNDSRVRPFARVFAGRTLASVTEEEAQVFTLEHSSTFKEVHAMFNDACRSKLVESNPFSGIKTSARKGRGDIVVLTDVELGKLAAMAHAVHGSYGGRFAAMIRVAAWTGLRPGELFLLSLAEGVEDGDGGERLNWADVERGEIHVDWQLNGRTGKVERPKMHARRKVVLLPPAEDALKGLEQQPGVPLFATKRGRPFSQRTFFYYWDPVRASFVASLPVSHHLRQRMMDAQIEAERAGVDSGNSDGNLDFYELRHFFGTKLAHPPEGVAAASQYEIAQQMGHSDNGQTALKYYVHTPKQDAQDSIRKAWRRAS